MEDVRVSVPASPLLQAMRAETLQVARKRTPEASPLLQAMRAETLQVDRKRTPEASPLLQAMRADSFGVPERMTVDRRRTPEASPMLQAMRTESIPSMRMHESAIRAGDMASGAITRVLSSRHTSPAHTGNNSPMSMTARGSPAVSRLASIDSVFAGVQVSHSRRSIQGFPQVYRDAFAGALPAHSEYGGSRPSSRASSRSGFVHPGFNRYSYHENRQQRHEILSEDDSSSDESPKKKRSPLKSTRNVLKSLDLRSSDIGVSSSDDDEDDSKASRSKPNRRDREMHFTTSSTDEDRQRRRAWAENHNAEGSKGTMKRRARHRKDGRQSSQSPSGRHSRSLNDSQSDDSFEGHESVLESALSFARSLEQEDKSRQGSVDVDGVKDFEAVLANSRNHTSPSKSHRSVAKGTVDPAVQSMLAAAYKGTQKSPIRGPDGAILSASQSPARHTPQVISGRRNEENGFILQTNPPYRPASNSSQQIGLPVYRVSGKYNLPLEKRTWQFEQVDVEECFDSYSWWKEKVIQARKSGVYEEEPHLLSETLSASMTEQQKFGTHSQFNRSKYRTQDRRKLGPKFDEYSPHVSKKPDFQNLPLEYRKMLLKSSQRKPGIRKSYMDEILKRGVAARDKHKAHTWSSVEAFFQNQHAALASNYKIDTHQYD